jgi:hypothetical protein
MNLSALPTELVFEIRNFIYRPDWKTCKLAESALIREHIESTKEYLQDNNLFLEEVKEWSLNGLLWLAYSTEYERMSRRRPLIPPPPYAEMNYKDPYVWYKYTFQWAEEYS